MAEQSRSEGEDYKKCLETSDKEAAAICLVSVGNALGNEGGYTEAIIRELNKAKSIILVQVYTFTSAPIAKALLDAHKRGVKVDVTLDKSQKKEKYSSATFFLNQGIPVRIDAKHAIAHSKVMVISGETVITRYFNFTEANNR